MERCWQTLGFESSGRTARIDALKAWLGAAGHGLAWRDRARQGTARQAQKSGYPNQNKQGTHQRTQSADKETIP